MDVRGQTQDRCGRLRHIWTSAGKHVTVEMSTLSSAECAILIVALFVRQPDVHCLQPTTQSISQAACPSPMPGSRNQYQARASALRLSASLMLCAHTVQTGSTCYAVRGFATHAALSLPKSLSSHITAHTSD